MKGKIDSIENLGSIVGVTLETESGPETVWFDFRMFVRFIESEQAKMGDSVDYDSTTETITLLREQSSI